jgi:uncharacterized alkaline shock family protein YloU
MAETRGSLERRVGAPSTAQGVAASSADPGLAPREDALPVNRNNALVRGDGRTVVADAVVAKIAGIAAREVAGVHALVAQGAGAAIAGLTQRVMRSDSSTHGVRVEVGEREAAVDLRLTVDYGASIPQVAEGVRRNVIDRIQSMTGLIVKEVNIEVSDLYFPEEEAPAVERRVE